MDKAVRKELSEEENRERRRRLLLKIKEDQKKQEEKDRLKEEKKKQRQKEKKEGLLNKKIENMTEQEKLNYKMLLGQMKRDLNRIKIDNIKEEANQNISIRKALERLFNTTRKYKLQYENILNTFNNEDKEKILKSMDYYKEKGERKKYLKTTEGKQELKKIRTKEKKEFIKKEKLKDEEFQKKYEMESILYNIYKKHENIEYYKNKLSSLLKNYDVFNSSIEDIRDFLFELRKNYDIIYYDNELINKALNENNLSLKYVLNHYKQEEQLEPEPEQIQEIKEDIKEDLLTIMKKEKSLVKDKLNMDNLNQLVDEAKNMFNKIDIKIQKQKAKENLNMDNLDNLVNEVKTRFDDIDIKQKAQYKNMIGKKKSELISNLLISKDINELEKNKNDFDKFCQDNIDCDEEFKNHYTNTYQYFMENFKPKKKKVKQPKQVKKMDDFNKQSENKINSLTNTKKKEDNKQNKKKLKEELLNCETLKCINDKNEEKNKYCKEDKNNCSMNFDVKFNDLVEYKKANNKEVNQLQSKSEIKLLQKEIDMFKDAKNKKEAFEYIEKRTYLIKQVKFNDAFINYVKRYQKEYYEDNKDFLINKNKK